MTPYFRKAAALQAVLLEDSLRAFFFMNPLFAAGYVPWRDLNTIQQLGRTQVSDERTSGTIDSLTAGERILRAEDLPLTDVLPDEPATQVMDEAVLRLLVEELSVGKQVLETGRLRVRRVTRERTEDVEVDEEHVEVEFERVPVGQVVEERPAMRETEDTIIIPVVEEIVVIERRLLLKEEIHVRKTRRVERRSEQVTLRSQDAEVLRLPPKGSPVTS